MKRQTPNAIRLVLATVTGYFLMVILITVVQEWIFGGVGYYESSMPTLVLTGAGTFLSAFTGGVVSALILKQRNYWPHWIICGLVALETTWFLTSGRAKSPAWFDLLASLSLLVATLTGGYLTNRRKTYTSL